MNGDSKNSGPTEAPSDELITSSQVLASSIPSLSSPSRHLNSKLSKTYKQASEFYLTRRLQESFATLQPIVTKQHDHGTEETADPVGDDHALHQAPIANGSRNIRIKVWNLYLALLNAIVELGPAQGKSDFGNKEWRDIVANVQNGSIWQYIVDVGYSGMEGRVDAEVVASLSTLLLSHSTSQTVNQQHIETYLSTSNHQILEESNSSLGLGQGSDSLQDLNTRIKILELYTLHVLPRNDEWQYAREFISVSDILDEENREAFAQALQDLQHDQNRDYKEGDSPIQEPTRKSEKAREPAHQGKLEDVRNQEAKSPSPRDQDEHPQVQHNRAGSEQDYGIENPPPSKPLAKASSVNGKPRPSKGSKSSSSTRLSPRSRAVQRATTPSGPAALYNRGTAMVLALKQLVLNLTKSISTNPSLMFRTILFLIGLILTFSKRDVRERLKRITGVGWDKVRGTVGMGVKVSYI
ncbi:hypothetical protein MMC09_002656 [Bachmanniomyces sp. S44760]|nr:hypothetical protein [Bachmanniomyces sp. S44760]